MKQMGDNSPERLARILSTLLSKEREKNDRDKEMFDQMVWGIIQRKEKKDGEADSDGTDADGPGQEPAGGEGSEEAP